MAPPSAWTTAALAAALAHGSARAEPPAPAEPSATAEPVAPEPTTPTETPDPAPQPGYVVNLSPGPHLARRMGTRVVLRPTSDGFGNRRSAVALSLPRPDSTDDPPPAQRVELPAGVWRVEVSAPGFLSSTREFTVDATRPEQTLAWDLLPDTLHADVRVPVTADGQSAVAVTATSSERGETWSCTARRTPCVFRLGPGTWTLEARARGFAPVRQDVAVPDAKPLAFPLTMTPGDDGMSFTTGSKKPVPTDMRKRVLIGLGASAVPLFAAGMGFTVAGRMRYIHAIYGDSCEGSYGAACGNALIAPVHMTGAGVGLLGATGGLLVTGVAGVWNVPAGAWWGMLGVGGAFALVGGVWVGANTVYLDRDLRSGPLSDINGRVDRRLAAATFLGFGLGTVAGSLTQALIRRRLNLQVAPHAARGQAGLVISGRF